VLTEYNSIGSSDEETDEMIMSQPAKKTKGIGGSAIKKSAPAPKAKKNAIKSDEESDGIVDYDDLPKGPPRSRVARGAAKKYVEVLSSDEDEDEDGEGSMFVDE
jgi:DNA topoisomerase II